MIWMRVKAISILRSKISLIASQKCFRCSDAGRCNNNSISLFAKLFHVRYAVRDRSMSDFIMLLVCGEFIMCTWLCWWFVPRNSTQKPVVVVFVRHANDPNRYFDVFMYCIN